MSKDDIEGKSCEFCGAPMATYEDRNFEPYECCIDDCQGEREAEDEATEDDEE